MVATDNIMSSANMLSDIMMLLYDNMQPYALIFKDAKNAKRKKNAKYKTGNC
jgi:hypothetical protein